LHVAIEIEDPSQHWVLSRSPAVNPAFGIAEVIWILAGSNDANILNYWFPGLPHFSGDGATYPGAYGYRLRRHFGLDQIHRAFDVLNANPDSRQVVLQYWDGRTDLPCSNGVAQTSDIPCNVISMLKVRDGRLDWTQVMRSSDVCRGLPYNFLQFTMLQEMFAGWLDLQLGRYHHWSDSLHAYTDSVNEFSINNSVVPEYCAENLRTNVHDGEILINEMYRRMTDLTKPTLGASDIIDLTLNPGLPAPYRNLLIILGAEASRRRNEFDQAQWLMKTCTNRQLYQAWELWWTRVSLAQNVG
jgi:thymidylate synthase